MGGFQQRPWTPTKRRGPIAAEFQGPGPASVTLPSTIGLCRNFPQIGKFILVAAINNNKIFV